MQHIKMQSPEEVRSTHFPGGIVISYHRSEKRSALYSPLSSSRLKAACTMGTSSLCKCAKNRWVGAYWQSKGRIVIPTVSWSTPRSFEFCFDGVELHATVAVSTLGCKKVKIDFMRGYEVMLEKLRPETIICFGDPFSEMQGNLLVVDYRESRKVVR